MKKYILTLIILFISLSLSSQTKDKLLEVLSDVPCYNDEVDTTKFINLSELKTDLSKVNQSFYLNERLYLLYAYSPSYSVFRSFITEPDSINPQITNILDYSVDIIFVDKERQRSFKFINRNLVEGGLEARKGKYFLLCQQNLCIDNLGDIEELSDKYPYKRIMALDCLMLTRIGQRDPKVGDITRISFWDKKTFEYTGMLYMKDLTPSHPYNIFYIDYDDFLNLYGELEQHEKIIKK